MKKLVLFVAVLALVLGGGSLAIAQTEDTQSSDVSVDQYSTDETTTDQTTTDQTTTEETTTDQTAADPSTLPCDIGLFRLEQQELVQSGYPTRVSDRARECESLGYINPYPAPFVLGSDGTVYPYDPIEGKYYYVDPDTGTYYVVDLDTGTAYPYDPATGTYL